MSGVNRKVGEMVEKYTIDDVLQFMKTGYRYYHPENEYFYEYELILMGEGVFDRLDASMPTEVELARESIQILKDNKRRELAEKYPETEDHFGLAKDFEYYMGGREYIHAHRRDGTIVWEVTLVDWGEEQVKVYYDDNMYYGYPSDCYYEYEQPQTNMKVVAGTELDVIIAVYEHLMKCYKDYHYDWYFIKYEQIRAELEQTKWLQIIAWEARVPSEEEFTRIVLCAERWPYLW